MSNKGPVYEPDPPSYHTDVSEIKPRQDPTRAATPTRITEFVVDLSVSRIFIQCLMLIVVLADGHKFSLRGNFLVLVAGGKF